MPGWEQRAGAEIPGGHHRPALAPPARPASAERARPWPEPPPTWLPRRAGKAPRYLRGHKGQIHGVAAAAAAVATRPRVLAAAAAASSAACAAGAARAEQRTGPRGPRGGVGLSCPAWQRAQQSLRPALQAGDSGRAGAGRGGARGPGAPHVTAPGPTHRGRARRSPRVLTASSLQLAEETETRSRPAGGCRDQPGTQGGRCWRPAPGSGGEPSGGR